MCAETGPAIAIVQMIMMFFTAMSYAAIFVTRREFTLVRTENTDTEAFELQVPQDEGAKNKAT